MSQTHSHDPAPLQTSTIIERDSGSGASMGMLFGALLAILVIGVVIWVAFAGRGAPTGGGQGTNPTINIERESPNSNLPSINIPKDINVNINQQPQGGGSEATSAP